MKVLDTMKTAEFARALEAGEFDDGGIASVVSTSDAALLHRIEETAGKHRLMDHVLAMGYDDVEDPRAPNAFADDLARMTRVFIADHAERTPVLLPVCDGGVSRSAAVLAAATRLTGGDDLACWTDPRYCPNVLVYRLVMRAAGVQMADRQIESRRELERAVADRKARKLSQVHTLHIHAAAFEKLAAGGEVQVTHLLEDSCLNMLPGDLAAVASEDCPDDIDLTNVVSLHVYGNLDDALADRGSVAAMEHISAEECEVGDRTPILITRLAPC